jgi:hypothetical protein
MRYAACYAPATVQVFAYVHIREDGVIRFHRPVRKGARFTVDYAINQAPEPAPDWSVPRGPGPEGTYHA